MVMLLRVGATSHQCKLPEVGVYKVRDLQDEVSAFSERAESLPASESLSQSSLLCACAGNLLTTACSGRTASHKIHCGA